MPNQWVTSSYQSHKLFYRAEPLMGSFPSASCRKVSVQRLLRHRIFFCSSIHQSGSGFAATRTVFPNKKTLLLSVPQGKGQVLLFWCAKPARHQGGERLNHARWQGRTMAVTSRGLGCAAVVTACSGGRVRKTWDPAPCIGSCYVLLSGRPVALINSL